MLIPLLASIVVESGGKVQNKNVLMAVGMGASAGGFCTMAGCTPQLVTQDFLITQGLEPMAFFDLTKVGVPMCFLMLVYFATIGYVLEKKILNFPDVIPGQSDCNVQMEDAPKWKQYLTGIVVLLCIGGFISDIWDLTVVSLIGVCVLTLTGRIDLRKSLREVDWNTLIIIAMSQSFAKGLESPGASKLIVEQMLHIFGGEQTSPCLVLSILMIVTIVLTNFMSNVAAISMILPIGVQSAIALGARPESFAIALTIGDMMGTTKRLLESGSLVETPQGLTSLWSVKLRRMDTKQTRTGL